MTPEQYAREVVAVERPAGRFHRLSCARHLADLERQATAGFPYRYDPEKAERFFRFAEQLTHYKGEWAGQKITLSAFQRFVLGSLFGWRHTETGFRRFTTAYIELPRKQGKSLIAAIVAVYVTFFEGEPGAEGYIVATKEKQATDIVFGDCKALIQSSGLRSKLRVQVKNIHRDATMSKLEPLGSDSDTLDGLNPHCIITDELHAFKSRGLLDVLETATGARRNPLHLQITTAGDDPVSVCGDQHLYATRVLEGQFDDLSSQAFFTCITHAEPEDDWLAESTWIKANPHYGISVKPEDLQKLALKAKNMPQAQAEFKQARLNLWVNASAPCLSMDGWRTGQTTGDRDAFEAALHGQPCFAGVDLASKIDLCALVLVFPPTDTRPTFHLIRRIWTPEETVRDRTYRDRAPYDVWIEQGWLETTPGTRIDHQQVRQALTAFRSLYRIEEVGFDPWHADTLIDELVTQDGFRPDQVTEVPQTYSGMSSACLWLQAEVLAGHVDACGDPVLAWAASNTVGQMDGKGNLMFTKAKSRGRIDPIIATAIGLAPWLRRKLEQRTFAVHFIGGRR